MPAAERTDTGRAAELAALQTALEAEHAAIYGYGVVGARVGDDRRKEAQRGYDAHRALRDELSRRITGLGGTPRAAAAAYALPFPVPDAAAAVRLAAELEDRVAAVHADLVRACSGARRRSAAGSLREAAVRAVHWRGSGVAFPGLGERATAGTPSATASGSAGAL